ELDYDDTSFMFSATWNVTDDLTLYGRYAEGYRGGGYDGQTSTNATFDQPYETEELTAYELGFKSHWLDSRVQLNGAFFLSDYDNLQLTVYTDGVSSIENAGKAEIRGMELEFLVQPIDDLRLGL